MTVLFNAFLWEFVQNLPVVLGFVTATWWWEKTERGKALAACLSGGASGAIVIRYTETWKIGRPFMEPWSVTLVNVIGFGLFSLLIAIYVGSKAPWSSRRVDVLLGVFVGGGFALAQGLASPDAPPLGMLLHSLALATAGAAVLVIVRGTKATTFASALGNGLLATLVMTSIITVIDYGYLVIG